MNTIALYLGWIVLTITGLYVLRKLLIQLKFFIFMTLIYAKGTVQRPGRFIIFYLFMPLVVLIESFDVWFYINGRATAHTTDYGRYRWVHSEWKITRRDI